MTSRELSFFGLGASIGSGVIFWAYGGYYGAILMCPSAAFYLWDLLVLRKPRHSKGTVT